MALLQRDFYKDLVPYRIEQFNGLDQTLSDVEQIRTSRTAACEGLSQRGGKLSSGQFGYGCLPFNWTKDAMRGFGITPALDKGYFYCTVGDDDGAGSIDSKTYYMNMFTFASTQLDTHKPKFLVSSGILNNRVVTADGNSLRKYYQASIYDDLVRQPPSPTFNSDSGTGINGSFYYRITLVDSAGNETGGGVVSAVRTVANKTINPTVDISAFNDDSMGYTKIRWYRSSSTTTPPTDLEELTYYYLGSSFDSVIAAITDTYTIADATADTDLVLNDELNNPIPVDGTFYADIVIQWDNRIFSFGTTEGSTYYGSRVRWSLLTDSTSTSLGNITSWRQQDFIDLDPDDGDTIIGAYGGLTGNGFVFKGDAAYRLTPTGASVAPYRADKINDQYGLYHHSIADTGNGLIGRTNDSLAMFNGSSFVQLGSELSSFFDSCTSQIGDSGAYDLKTKRYYCSVFWGGDRDSSRTLTGALQSIVNVYRNATVCFDFKEKNFEVHSDVFLQVLKNLEDSRDASNIFAVGPVNDFHMLMNNSMTGVTFCDKAAISGPTTATLATVTLSGNALAGRSMCIPIFIDSGNNQITFNEFNTFVSSTSGAVVTFNDNIIFSTRSSFSAVVLVDASYGTTTTRVNDLKDNGNNYFLASNISDFMAVKGDANGQVYDPVYDSQVGVNSSTDLTVGVHTFASGLKYILTQTIKFFGNHTGTPSDIYYRYYLSPRAFANSTMRTKSFRFVQLSVRGNGVLRVRTFVDGSKTANQTLYYSLSDRAVWKVPRIDLNGVCGMSLAVEIGMARGAGEFECQGMTVWARMLGGLRTA